ncbi:UNVERIFIED_CONTAM: hypothetical protein K2H54_023495 [Gekko kuhli]
MDITTHHPWMRWPCVFSLFFPPRLFNQRFEEMNVKVVGDYAEVHAKHEEPPDKHGYISQEFHRRYVIPKGTDPASVTLALSPDRVFSITAPVAQGALPQECTHPLSCQINPWLLGSIRYTCLGPKACSCSPLKPAS